MRNIVVSIISCIILTSGVFAQNTSDALRLSLSGYGVGARSLGLGMSNISTADDFSATYSNPAGLGQMHKNELSFGLSNFNFSNSASYLGNSKSYSNSSTSLNNIGIVYSLPTTRGSLVLAFGYARSNDFATSFSYNGLNRYSSMVLSENDIDFNTAYQLYLVDDNNLTPFVDSLEQRGKVLEDGGINNWVISGAVEIAQNLYLGATLNFVSGSYSYTRTHTELDILNKYSVARYDTDAVSQWGIVNTIDETVSGFTSRFGMLYKLNSRAKLGLTVKIPTYYTLHDDYSTDGTSYFDVAHSDGYTNYSYRTIGSSEFDVTTPFVLGAGFSFGGEEVMLTGSVEYTDWTQMKFSNTDPYLEQTNIDIKEIFTPTADLHIGAEVYIPETTVRLRGGFAYLPSQYKDDPSENDKKVITGGIGILASDVFMIDIGVAHSYWNTDHLVYQYYDNTLNNNVREIVTEKITTNNIMATFSYRF